MWILLAFNVALFDSIRNVIAKSSLKKINENVTAFSNCFFSVIFLLPILFFIPNIKPEYFYGVFISGIFNVVALVLFMKSIKSSDLSKTVPLTAISPLLLLITSPIIVGEFPNVQGIIGMILIVAGAYLLNFKNDFKGILAPFKAIIYEKGPRYMLIVVLLWSISANFDKVGVKGSSPIFYAFSIQIFISLILFLYILIKKQFSIPEIKKNFVPLISLGFTSAVTIISYVLALTMTIVPYVIAIKRTNSILSVFFGKIFFNEGDILNRLIAVIIMFIGVLLITFS